MTYLVAWYHNVREACEEVYGRAVFVLTFLASSLQTYISFKFHLSSM